MRRFSSAVLAFSVLFTLQLSAQSGKYDLNFALSHVDCDEAQLYVDIQIKAHDETCTFRLSDQNYRLQFNEALVNNSAFIAQELEISGYVESPTGYSLYKTHTLIGSFDSIVSYNIEFIAGEGSLLKADEWTDVGQLGFDIADIESTVNIVYMDESMFPPTFVGEFYDELRTVASSGNFAVFEINLQDYCDAEDPESDSSTDSGSNLPENTTTGVVNSEIENSVSLFPSLTTDFINLRCGDNICGDLRIIDVQGRVVQNWQAGQNATSVSNFDVSTLASGTYFLQLNINEYYLTRRFIKI